MKEIWDAYQLYASTCAVRRKGFELVGMTAPTPDEVPDIADSFVSRGESDLEHQAKVSWLASAIIGSGNDTFFELLPHQSARLWSIITVALCHDVGEISVGDIPHDGNALHDTKDEIEKEVFNKMADIYSPWNFRFLAVGNFKNFQDKTTHNGKAIYALDKLDAVLTQLLYEKHGCSGSILLKPEPTDSDNYYMQMTGTDNSADCWAAHTVSLIRDFPPQIKNVVLDLIDIAVHDVRGEPFDWWDKDILPYKRDH